jgi:putative sterol carrier protein
MGIVRYCTPEWITESAKLYEKNPALKLRLKKLKQKMCYLVKADPDWGIDKDIIFGAAFNQGELLEFDFFNRERAEKEADFILEATPEEWVSILRKKYKFIPRFMMKMVKLYMGENVDVLRLAPYANELIEVLTSAQVQYPDEMSPEELEAFRAYVNEFRDELGI